MQARSLLLLLFLCCAAAHAQSVDAPLQPWVRLSAGAAPVAAPQLRPAHFASFRADEGLLKAWLYSLSTDRREARLLLIPTSGSGERLFRVWQTPVMEASLGARYPGIRTFTATAVDAPGVTAKINWDDRGFRAMIYEAGKTAFIDPYGAGAPGLYIAYYKRDYRRPSGSGMDCGVADAGEALDDPGLDELEGLTAAKTHGTVQRTYRLALACTGEYAVAVAGPSPTKADVLAAMVTSINRVNGVYETELAVTLQLIANTDTLINLDASTDPYDNFSGSVMLGQNQTTIDARAGNTAYDIGHVFSTGGGGVASLNSVCDNSDKARGVTGGASPVGDPFDIDYVAHEMGHQFNANHTFNSNQGSCSGAPPRSNSNAYEPGSGTTIMAYAGICGADDTQPNSDPFFHARSLFVISNYITNTASGGSCPVSTTLANVPPLVPALPTGYAIPYRTPFELEAPEATDADHDVLTYSWEQYNRGDYGAEVLDTSLVRAPLFRSFPPDAGRVRVFPALPKVVTNVDRYVGEQLPDTTRRLTFRLTVRDELDGIGAFNFSDDSTVLNVIETGAPFEVTSQGLPVAYTGNTAQTVTWNVAGTDAAPIAAPTVDIFFSLDSGYTYPYTLVSGTPNDGSAVVLIPNVATTAGRIKVKGAGNVFFDLNQAIIEVVPGSGEPEDTAANAIVSHRSLSTSVQIYPVPASDVLHLKADGLGSLGVLLINPVGQPVWEGVVDGSARIPVAQLPTGVYLLRLFSAESGETAVRRVMIR